MLPPQKCLHLRGSYLFVKRGGWNAAETSPKSRPRPRPQGSLARVPRGFPDAKPSKAKLSKAKQSRALRVPRPQGAQRVPQGKAKQS